MSYELDVILRLVAAALAGIVIGFNRDIRHKALGMRTLAIVALGAAVVTIAALEYTDLDQPDAQSRVLQGIVQGVLTGVGFIGAGVILRDPRARQVQGLTTAATVWVTAALGVACALGAWLPAIVGAILTIFVLFVVRKLEEWMLPDR
jgi:putative Mg2+ transporter-C (MgtC) family protein